jgi:hypothetical protein
LLDEQRRRHRTIHAAAHGDDDFLTLGLHRLSYDGLNVLNGLNDLNSFEFF